jgi:addiction module HigA family antidote
MNNKLAPVHPGEVLQKDFLEPLNLTQNKLAGSIRVSARRVNEIVLKKRSITADTALRLARFFGNSPKFWMGLQDDYDLDVATDKIGGTLLKMVHPFAKAV